MPRIQDDYFSWFNQSDHCFLALWLPLPSSLLELLIIVEVGGMIDEHYDWPSTNSEQYYIIVHVGLFPGRWKEEWMGTKLISQFAQFDCSFLDFL